MKNFIKHGLKPLVLLITFLAFTASGVAYAQTGGDDLQFTSIPTKADSLKAFKKKQDSIAKAKKDSLAKVAIAKPAGKPGDKPKTLWQVFIAGFLGGFLAFLMPCIYPMLPLTVSFFTKKAGSRSKGIFQSFNPI